MLKEQPMLSLGRASLYPAVLVLQHMRAHTRNRFLPTLCRKPNHLFLTDICQYPSPAFTLLLLHHTCSTPSQALTHAHCRPLLLPHRMSSFLSIQGRRWPFVQL